MRYVLFSFAAFFAAGCGAMPKPSETLISELRGYNEGLRWQQHVKAAVRIPPDERDDFIDERALLEEELRISDYEVTRLSYTDEERTRAHVRVRWSWHLDRKGIVYTTTTGQEWRRYGKHWLMVEERRVSGEPMPGMAEPAPPADRDAGPGPTESAHSSLVEPRPR